MDVMDALPPGLEAPVPGLDAQAAQRWRHHPREASPWLNEEVAARMAERLHLIKQPPPHWLHWSPLLGGLQGHHKVAAIYPQARVSVAGEGAEAVARALKQQSPKGWNPLKWLAPAVPVHQPGQAEVDMLWANMALHLTPTPRALLAQWRDALRVDGFLMFSCLGPDTLREVRAVFERQQWPAATHAYTDMHDWGDMLVEVGFAEPVMDMERITLAYPSARRLLQDLRDWGRNLHTDRFAALRGKGWRTALETALEQGLPRDAQGQLLLTIEVIYGHAYKPTPRVKLASTSTVSVDDMRALLRQPRPTR